MSKEKPSSIDDPVEEGKGRTDISERTMELLKRSFRGRQVRVSLLYVPEFLRRYRAQTQPAREAGQNESYGGNKEKPRDYDPDETQTLMCITH